MPISSVQIRHSRAVVLHTINSLFIEALSKITAECLAGSSKCSLCPESGITVQVDEEWQPEGWGFVSHPHVTKLFPTGKGIAWPRSKWECAEEQRTWYIPWTPSLCLSLWIILHPLQREREVYQLQAGCSLTGGTLTQEHLLNQCRLEWR